MCAIIFLVCKIKEFVNYVINIITDENVGQNIEEKVQTMANDFYNGGDDNKAYHKTVALCVAAASMVVLLFLIVLYVQSDDKKHKMAKAEQVEEVQEENVLDSAHNFTSDELDFWEDDGMNLDEVTKDPEGDTVSYKKDEDTRKPDKSESDSEDEEESEDESKNVDKKKEGHDDSDISMNNDADDDADADADHLAVTDEKGTKKYYEVLSKVPKNDYDFDEYLVNDEGKLSYEDKKREALKGIDLSKYNGAVDFEKVKEAGIDYAMLRLGSRGYGTGAITLDEKFVEYAQNAALHNIPIGAYFFSQAITTAEAVEEANYIVGAVGTFNIKYPIAIDIEEVTEDEARTEDLTVKERTAVVKAFCDTVKSFGYKPAIYASRDMLIAGLDLEELDGIDVWLSDSKIPTDYPYKFTMWQYSDKGRIEGIDRDVDLNLSFVNYEQR